MADYTNNLNLKQPAGTDDALISDINDNMTKIDNFAGTALKQINPPVYNGDCDDIDETCVVYVTDQATNSPGAWCLMQTVVYASNAIAQYAFSVTGNTMKIRTKSTTWSAWKEITKKNDRAFNIVEFSKYINSTGSLTEWTRYIVVRMPVEPGYSYELVSSAENSGTYNRYVDANGTQVGSLIQNLASGHPTVTVPSGVAAIDITMFKEVYPQIKEV